MVEWISYGPSRTPGLSDTVLPGTLAAYCRAPEGGSRSFPERYYPANPLTGCGTGIRVAARKATSMRMPITLVAVAVTVSLATPALLAHHGRGASFDMNKQVTLKGTVSRVDWRNPHVVIHMDVKDAA